MAIDHPGQVWCADVTYLPKRRGYCYLVAIMDWYSRRVLSFRLSNTLDARVLHRALAEALDRYDAPQIFNTDQRSQFTLGGPSPACFSLTASRSAWTAGGAGWTTSSSSGCGGA
jgi:transposase InsO family protein